MSSSRLHYSLLKNPVHLLALGLGAGLAPKAPGTFGTAMGVALYLALPALDWPVYLALLLLLALFGIGLCGRSAELLGVHDHGGIVWDEMVGIWITLFLVPPGWGWLLLGFVLFRLLDVLKPWPISVLDRSVHGGLGIMVDDILAGVLACGGVQAVALLMGAVR